MTFPGTPIILESVNDDVEVMRELFLRAIEMGIRSEGRQGTATRATDHAG